MSQLAIYRGIETNPQVESSVSQGQSRDDQAFEPQIYSFKEAAARLRFHQRSRLAERARLMLENQTCPICSRCGIEPIELHDGQIGRNGASIPGTGTLVGFSCHTCGHEWPV